MKHNKTRPLPFFIRIPGISEKLAAWLKVVVFATLALAYLFWNLDVIPDIAGPIVGRVDDAIILLVSAWAIRGAIKTILKEKEYFMGK